MSNRMAVVGRGHEVMSRYSALLLVVLCVIAAPGVVSTAAAQARASDAENSEVPRTPDGRPDLQGDWTNSTMTPFQRRADQGPVYTPEEVAEIEQGYVDRFVRGAQPSDPDRPPPERQRTISAADSYNNVYFETGNRVAVVNGEPRASLITLPSNGRIPELTPEAQRLQQVRRELRSQFGQYDHPEMRPLAERCIFFGSPSGPPMFPVGAYNSNYVIVQTADYLMIMSEMVHDARIIRIGEPNPMPRSLRPYFGNSWGRWEGDTLVVETTNLSPEQLIRGVSPSEDGVVIERFTRVDEETILYEFTVEDPTRWTQPWGGQIPIKKLHAQVYEYACHEGNYALSNVLSGARYQERMEAQRTNDSGRD